MAVWPLLTCGTSVIEVAPDGSAREKVLTAPPGASLESQPPVTASALSSYCAPGGTVSCRLTSSVPTPAPRRLRTFSGSKAVRIRLTRYVNCTWDWTFSRPMLPMNGLGTSESVLWLMKSKSSRLPAANIRPPMWTAALRLIGVWIGISSEYGPPLMLYLYATPFGADTPITGLLLVGPEGTPVRTTPLCSAAATVWPRYTTTTSAIFLQRDLSTAGRGKLTASIPRQSRLPAILHPA